MKSGAKTVRRVLPYFWPKGETGLRIRVVLCILVLLSARIVNICAINILDQCVYSMDLSKDCGFNWWVFPMGLYCGLLSTQVHIKFLTV
jgi:hypothetical protein